MKGTSKVAAGTHLSVRMRGRSVLGAEFKGRPIFRNKALNAVLENSENKGNL